MPDMNSTSSSRTTLPFGSWPSPVSAASVAGKSLRLAQPQLSRGVAWWLETRPQEQGRTVLVRWTPGSGCEDVTPEPYSVQSKVHEYGGGAFAVDGKTAWFVNRNDQRVYVVENANVRALTNNDESWRFADLVPDPERDRLLCVIEVEQESAEPKTVLGAISCDDGEITILREGADFYSSPRISPNGKQLAWLEWDHPDMPWDATRLLVAGVDGNGSLGETSCVAGGVDESVLQPLWRNDDELLFVSDRSNWWNLYAANDGDVRELLPMQAEFAVPHWVFNMRTFGLRDPDTLACAFTRNGVWSLGELDLPSGRWREIDLPYTQIEHVHAADGAVVLQAASARLPATIALLENNNVPHVLREAADVSLDDAFLAPPEPVEFETGDGETAYGLYYAPAHDRFRGEPGTAPPLLVKVHGGPTGATSSALDLKIRFWTSRGFAVLDVNYRGSTGYGREYRKKLHGQWGIADVEDCIRGARELSKRGLADPERLLISGSSAGGFTVLAALTFHDVFAAGASYYGVADLAAAMRDTGKFESRYGDRLVGPLPQTEHVWRERSPVFHAERLTRPVIFFQGLEDRVVPPDQSERMYEAARANGVQTAYHRFRTEGHGFRQAATIETALNAEYTFYCDVLGIEMPAESDSRERAGGANH